MRYQARINDKLAGFHTIAAQIKEYLFGANTVNPLLLFLFCLRSGMVGNEDDENDEEEGMQIVVSLTFKRS
jgi:hypothetical protein